MIHPKGEILNILAEAGIPNAELHTTADRILQAYDQQNGEGDGAEPTTDVFGGIEPGWPGNIRFAFDDEEAVE